MWFFVGIVAHAAPGDWETRPYVQPVLNVSATWVNGRSIPQATLGTEAGLVYQQRPAPHWRGRTRVAAHVIYGFSSDNTGYDLRLGSFFGPNGKIALYQAGPDLWFNGYGTGWDTLSYYLPPSFGVSLPQTVLFKVHPPWIGLLVQAVPSWAFNPERNSGSVGPFHELSLLGAAVFDVEGYTLTVGYQRSWNAAGVVEGLVLSGSL